MKFGNILTVHSYDKWTQDEKSRFQRLNDALTVLDDRGNKVKLPSIEMCLFVLGCYVEQDTRAARLASGELIRNIDPVTNPDAFIGC